MKPLRPLLLTVACFLASPLAPANDLPMLGDASSAIVSPEQEHLLGRTWLSLLRGQVRQLSDPLLKDYVESSVYRLAESSQLDDRRLEFVLLDSPQLNAFAAPGGIIGVNGGLFLSAQTEAEYASVMAHELAHLSQRHFSRGLEAQQRMQLPLMAAMLAGVVAAAARAGDAIMSAQAAAMQEQRRFSRQNEQEADRIGLVNLERAGYDPRAMPSMFERLMRQYRYDRKPPEFLLTHPVSESRIADTRNRAELYAAGGVKDSLRYQLMRARVQLNYESTPGLATKRFRAQVEENPELDAARYGLSIAQIRAGQISEAHETLQPLLAKAPNEIIYNLAQVDIDVANQQLDAAQQRVERMIELFPRSVALQQARADVLLKRGRIADAEAAYNRLAKERPKDPDIWYLVAEVRGLAGNTVGLHEARAEYFALVGDYDPAIEQLDLAKRRSKGNFQLAARIDARQKVLQQEQRMVQDLLR
jgi:predicted Zn-dependent protease